MVVYDFYYTLPFKGLGLVRFLFKVSHAHNISVNTQKYIKNKFCEILLFKINLF